MRKKMPFDSQPSLEGSLVRLRPLYPDDEDALYSVAADPLIWKQHPVSNRHIRTEFDKFFSEAIESRGALLVIDAQTGNVIGSSRYFGFSDEQSRVEIGWTFLARSYWGGKYNGEVKRLMLEHAFKYVDTVVFYIDPENRRSQRSVEKIGAVKDADPDSKGRLAYRIEKSNYGIEYQP
jgi:RimJ/RimL family protein N-acetyltransferase